MIVAWFVRGQKHAALCETSMAAAKRLPNVQCVVATDDPEVTVPGAEMLRFEPGLPLMVANIEAQLAVLEELREPTWFIDTDVLLLKPMPDLWDEQLCVTWRDTVGGEIDDVPGGVADVMPYNYGVVGASPGRRVIEAFIWIRERIRKLSPQLQLWWGNQIVLASLVGPRPVEDESFEHRPIPWRIEEPGPMLPIRKIPGSTWNYTPKSADEDLSEKGAVHFKGHTRDWMRPVADKMGLPWRTA